jgi:alpha-beta hydrolase superfamily lysophospholipase
MDTRAHWSTAVPKTLVVFVHGFGGQSVATWLQFPTLLARESVGSGCDFVFYGYDGRYTRAVFSAAALRHFLRTMLTEPASIVNPTLDSSVRRNPSFRYERAVLVAHSLGAVVTRRALLDAHLDHEAWLSMVQMVLFAPAHRGAEVIRLGMTALTGLPIGKVAVLIGPLLEHKFQVLLDLKTTSTTIADLERDARAAAETAGESGFLRAARVIFGDRDNIVEPGRFVSDPPPVVIPGRTHTSICKPISLLDAPLIQLKELL